MTQTECHQTSQDGGETIGRIPNTVYQRVSRFVGQELLTCFEEVVLAWSTTLTQRPLIISILI
jgi:hypothetical protein